MPRKYTPDEAAAAFCAKVNRDGPTQPRMSTPCWVWTAGCLASGYGQVWWSGRLARAHRVAWMLVNGPIPDGLHVLHHCDNPPCVNPAHLWIGTDADNVADMMTKGRGGTAPRGDMSFSRVHPERLARGERNGSAKLTDEKVLDVLARYSAGESQRALARAFGVSHRAIGFIVRNEAWKHVSQDVRRG